MLNAPVLSVRLKDFPDLIPMKRHLPLLLASLVLPLAGASVPAQAQEIKIAVVDMQEALNKYYKTEIQVKDINDLADEKRKNLDERQAAYQQMTNQMTELDAVYKDTSLAESKRKEALEKLQALFQERQAKAKEISDAQRKASAEVMTARQEMEATLVDEIKKTVDGIVQAQGLDLVFDKSFLPKANKAILYTSANVKDLTTDVIAALNAGAPATTSTN
jgi:Skp family chaperone for outer membrane proteins